MTEGRPVQGISRRAVVAGLGFAGVFLFLPKIVLPVAAQGNPKHKTFARILNEAIQTRNIGAAIERNGKSLAPAEKQILLSLSAAELETLRSFRQKLGRLGVIDPI
jgi:hypothetical protein